MTVRNISIVALLSLLLVGCATTTPSRLSEYHEAKPRSILIVPVVNNSVEVMAGTSVLTTLPKLLGEKGYYVFPVNTVKSMLEFEGFNSAQEIHNQPSVKLAGLFHADAILYVTINKWASEYILVSTTTKVDFDYKIVSAAGEVLWEQNEALAYSPSNESSSGSFLADVLASAITAAVERAKPNYLELTRQANYNVFYQGAVPLPPGPYALKYSEYYQSIADQEAKEAQLSEPASEAAAP